MRIRICTILFFLAIPCRSTRINSRVVGTAVGYVRCCPVTSEGGRSVGRGYVPGTRGPCVSLMNTFRTYEYKARNNYLTPNNRVVKPVSKC